MKMKDLKKIITQKIISSGFDTVGFSIPEVNSTTKQRYQEFLSKNYRKICL